MKMPNARANRLLSTSGYGGLDGTPRPQPTSDTFRNARMHAPRHRSDDIEADAPRKSTKQTIVNVNVGADRQDLAEAKQEGMKAGVMQGVQLGAKLAMAKMSGGAAPGQGGSPVPPQPPRPAMPPMQQSGPAPAPMPTMRRGGRI